MRLNAGLRIALLVGLAMAAAGSVRKSAVAEQTDDRRGTETSESGEPVSLRVTDLDSDWDDVTFAELQPPPEGEPGVLRRWLDPNRHRGVSRVAQLGGRKSDHRGATC